MADEAKEFEWPPLESNPEIFTSYMQEVGMSKEWGFGEVFGFDEDLLAFLPQPVLGVIANVERLKKSDDKLRGDPDTKVDFYMKQTGKLDNACGVIACLHTVYNNLAAVGGLDGESILGQHMAATATLGPDERAAALEANTSFQNVHKKRAGEGDSVQASEQKDVKHHFVAFVVNEQKQLVELDGTKKGPLVVAENCEDVLRGTISLMQQRLQDGEYSDKMALMTLNPAQ